jgi:hypothetical protein
MVAVFDPFFAPFLTGVDISRDPSQRLQLVRSICNTSKISTSHLLAWRQPQSSKRSESQSFLGVVFPQFSTVGVCCGRH